MKFRIFRDIKIIAILLLMVLPISSVNAFQVDPDNVIQPYTDNNWYWQYKGEPILLRGGSDDDNHFQWTDEQLTEHLDLLISVGGNYVRNTMSDRDENNVFAFAQNEDGLYDLTQWNEEYWNRLEFFLNETEERGIIVQLTLWDQFDISGHRWNTHPWNPENNSNMEAGSWEGKEDFYATVDNNDQQGLHFQQQFIEKLLGKTLEYGHVLYNINNESSESTEWQNYWAQFVKELGSKSSHEIYVTTMQFDPSTSVRHVMTYPEIFDFFEISQNNQDSRGARGQGHWDNIMYWRTKIASFPSGPMPMNNVKVYGGVDGVNYSAGSEKEAIHRFWRNIFAGSASSRFHRPAGSDHWGSGLNEKVQVNLKAMDMLLKEFDIFTSAPHNDLLLARVPVPSTMEAYASARIGEQYAVYFPAGRFTVNLDPWIYAEKLEVRWLDIENLTWLEPELLEVQWEGGQDDWGYRRSIRLTTPGKRPFVALINVME
ncbi:MAG: hypothetical protein CL670_00385 [Balneola sp.]|mgnify:CR=1 FL=1|nr:hypothetical protein [Balneola sp.]MBE77592.1 hypothetical protein [Balneola sp.]|tara:strand:- start:254 stop:1708 length:1455 start_codon:yes stop_codon:yes gene_type:complete